MLFFFSDVLGPNEVESAIVVCPSVGTQGWPCSSCAWGRGGSHCLHWDPWSKNTGGQVEGSTPACFNLNDRGWPQVSTAGGPPRGGPVLGAPASELPLGLLTGLSVVDTNCQASCLQFLVNT